MKLESFHCFAGELSNFFKFRSTIHQLSKGIESNQKSEGFFSSIKESSHEHRFIRYDSQGKSRMHVFECSERERKRHPGIKNDWLTKSVLCQFKQH